MTAGPPFEHYPVSAGAMVSSANAIAARAQQVQAVAMNVQSAATPAINNVFGVVSPPVISAPKPVLAQSQQLMQQTVFAAGAVRMFGKAIATYDAGIDRLNDRWNAGVASDFGVTAAVIPAGAKPAERQNLESAHTQAISAARQKLRLELIGLQKKLEHDVDQTGNQVATMISQGPTTSNLNTIQSSGGFDIFPALVSMPGGIARSVLFASAEAFAKEMARTAPGLIGPTPLRPGSPLFNYSGLSPEEAKWLGWAKGFKIGGTALGLGVTGLNQHLKDLQRYPNMDSPERVGRDGGAILSKGLPALGAGALTAAAIASAPVTVPAVVVGGAVIAVGTGVGYAVNKWGGPITEPIINAAGDATEWAWNAGGDAANWSANAADDTVSWAGDRVDDVGNAIDSVLP